MRRKGERDKDKTRRKQMLSKMIEEQVKQAANKAIEVAKAYVGNNDPRVAAEHGLALATKGQFVSFKNAVRAEMRKRGFRI